MLVEPLCEGAAGVTLGSRFLREEDQLAVPRLKRWILSVAVLVNRVATGIWLADARNGLRALTAEAAGRIQIQENRFTHATETLDEISRKGLRYIERPTAIRYTEYSKAKGQPVSNALNIVVDLILKGLFK